MAFQTFDIARPSPETIRQRIAALRARFTELGIDAILVPHEDEYLNETLPEGANRLADLTGFTGSAGRAVVTEDDAVLITDGRYTLQARAQAPEDVFAVVSQDEDAVRRLTGLGAVRLGVDPSRHTRASLEKLQKDAPEATLVRLEPDPVGRLVNAAHAPADPTIRAHPANLAGASVAEKLAAVRKEMGDGVDAALVAASDGVSWLLNWRGSEVAHVPVVLSRAFVPREGKITVFVAPERVSDALLHAQGEGLADIRFEPPERYIAHLAEHARDKTVLADPAQATDAALAAIERTGTLKTGRDPTLLPKAVKNAAEIDGMRAAHQRDGVAMVRFLAFLERHGEGLSEIEIVERLEEERRRVGAIDISFDTIAGSGPNGAIVHYRVDRQSNRTLQRGEALLVDSGGQYEDGTTDITRTMVCGPASEDFRRAFTRVLKGHIALARQRFPAGTRGSALDALARAALWQAGQNYSHGTGHGVGAALDVHEGPAGISPRTNEPLQAGMIVSNEPGFYVEGGYGIRIENLMLVRAEPGEAERPFLSFEALTLAPIDTRLVLPRLLTPEEIAWLDGYHARVHGALVADLDAPERAWLNAATRPIVG